MSDQDTASRQELGFRPVSERFVNQADYAVGRLVALVPCGTTVAHVLHPMFFRNVLSRLSRNMRIEVISEDLDLDCEVRVEKLTQSTAHVRLLRAYERPEGEMHVPASLPPPTIDFGGPKHQWRFGMPDGKGGMEIIRHGFPSQKEAYEGAKAYYATLTSAPMPEPVKK